MSHQGIKDKENIKQKQKTTTNVNIRMHTGNVQNKKDGNGKWTHW